MKRKTTIKKVAEAWNKKLWGFYDLQFDNGFIKFKTISCFNGIFHCGFSGEMKLEKVSAGFFPCGFSYVCPNCGSRLDAEMIKS